MNTVLERVEAGWGDPVFDGGCAFCGTGRVADPTLILGAERRCPQRSRLRTRTS